MEDHTFTSSDDWIRWPFEFGSTARALSREVPVSVTEMIEIPAETLAAGRPLPSVCAKHGFPAVQRVDFAVRSQPDLGSPGRLAIPGYTALNRAEEYLKKVAFVEVRGWPLCARCVRRRRLGRVAAAALLFGGVAAMILSVIVTLTIADGDRRWSIPFLAGFAAVILSPWPFSWAGLPKVTQTRASPAGTAVLVDHPDDEFRRRLR
ncbi:hypothetical protein AB0F81_08890 [Actinoplanes sp. NPDC024001]|uniref:hypothetical protein n=1 Tax=Actinoplanes sp. NPDC024001 TaxID=3154598 RepID=UPI0033CC4F1A